MIFLNQSVFTHLLIIYVLGMVEPRRGCLKYICNVQHIMLFIKSVAEFKEFERRFKFKPRFKYGGFHLQLHQMFQDLSRRLI